MPSATSQTSVCGPESLSVGTYVKALPSPASGATRSPSRYQPYVNALPSGSCAVTVKAASSPGRTAIFTIASDCDPPVAGLVASMTGRLSGFSATVNANVFQAMSLPSETAAETSYAPARVGTPARSPSSEISSSLVLGSETITMSSMPEKSSRAR